MGVIPLHLSRPLSPQVEAALALETKKLLVKGAIEVVQDPSSPGLYSHLFLVDKRDAGDRSLFAKPTLGTNTFQNGDNVFHYGSLETGGMDYVHVDLKDAYFHIRVAKSLRKYLWFIMGNKVFQFRALPFGLAMPPLSIYEGHGHGGGLCPG